MAFQRDNKRLLFILMLMLDLQNIEVNFMLFQLGPLHIFSLKKTHNITPFIIYILLKVYYISQINV